MMKVGMNDQFAQKLALLRAQKGLTQRELGAAAGVAWSMISKYESGQSKPRLKVLLKLAEALGCSVGDIQGDAPIQKPFTVYKGFSARLLNLRINKKLSPETLSKMTGIDPVLIERFETGEDRPSTEDVRLLAEALGVNILQLSGTKDEPETVRVRLTSIEEPGEEDVVFSTTHEAYKSLLKTADQFGMTPAEVISRYIDAISAAAADPASASKEALKLLNGIKMK